MILSVIASSIVLLSVGPDGTPFRYGSNGCRISADGRWVAMEGHLATWSPGMSVRDLVTDTLAPVPFVPGVTSAELRAISSNGDAILYTSGETLYVYEQATGMTTDVIPGAYGSNLSPDGRYVLYSASPHPGPLMMHDRTTSVDVQLDQGGSFSTIGPTMSQDNRYVAFSRGVLDRSTGKVTQLEGSSWMLPTISGDGRYVAYATQLPQDIADPMHCRIVDRWTRGANVIWFPDGYNLHFTHDGRYLLLTNDYSSSIYDRDAPRGGGATDLGFGQYADPAISDDGQRIAYTGSEAYGWRYQSYLLTR